MFLDHRIGFKRGSGGDTEAVAESAASAPLFTNGALSCHRRRSAPAREEPRLMYRGGGLQKQCMSECGLMSKRGRRVVGGLRESASVRDPR